MWRCARIHGCEDRGGIFYRRCLVWEWDVGFREAFITLICKSYAGVDDVAAENWTEVLYC